MTLEKMHSLLWKAFWIVLKIWDFIMYVMESQCKFWTRHNRKEWLFLLVCWSLLLFFLITLVVSWRLGYKNGRMESERPVRRIE